MSLILLLRSQASVTFTGTGSVTTAAAAISGTAALEFSGSGDFTGAAASLDSTGTLEFTGTTAWTGAAASLDILGQLQYNGNVDFTAAAASLTAEGLVIAAEEIVGTADVTSAAASFAATGTVSTTVTGVGDFTSAPATFGGRGRQRRKAGHDLVDLARYNAFVEQGEAILEELGQTPEPTGAETPTLDPVPTVQPDAPADYREFLARTLDTIRVDPLAIPTLAVKGKQWVKGSATFHTESAWIVAQGHLSFLGATQTHSMPSRLGATGSVDNYYTIRKQDDELLAEFLLANLSGVL